jgi:Flp pilus assembly protein TadG
MLYRSQSRVRWATTVVECAFVYPIVLFLLFTIIVSGLGVFRYQQLAALAREGARWATVHGERYQRSTGQKAADPVDVYEQAIAPKMVGLDPALFSYSVTWSPNKRQGSMVTVTVSYQWIPETYFGGVTLTSTSSMPMSY